MALGNITIPAAALLFAVSLACAPAMAAPAGSQSSSGGGGNSHSSGGGGTSHSSGGHGAHSAGGGHFHGGGTHFAGHRSSAHFHRSHGNGAFFYGFGAPYPYYYEGDGYLVCRYRRVRYHGHWVRRRYCWHQF